MTQQALSRHAPAYLGGDRWTAAGIVHFVFDRFLLLPLGAAIALVWANTAGESYFAFAHQLAFPVNEIAMAFFFGLLTQELVEAVMPGGALHTWRRWSTAIVAAIGGIAGAAGVYLAVVQLKYETLLIPGWPVACAVDAAAAYYLLRLLYPRSAVLPFALLLAIVTNIFGVIVVGLSGVTLEVRAGGVALMVLAMAVAAALRMQKVRSFWPYLAIAGTLSWLAFYVEGMHPAFALVPIVPFLRHEPRRLDLFADPPDDDATHHYEHEWNVLVQVILFFFGLVNAGVLLRQYDTGTWAILAAALVGRPVGIMLAVGLAVLAGLHLPKRMGWRELVVVALATSSGFTFALFFATGLFPMGPTLSQIKMGALATVIGALLTFGAARLLHVGPRASRQTR
jgi:NhaA family Na+:H+ antiporter